MAGVLLRHVITGHWIRIDNELKVAIKRNLFGMLAQEGVYVGYLNSCSSYSRLVRRTLANLLSKVARVVLSSGETWPELVPSLFEISKSTEADHREVLICYPLILIHTDCSLCFRWIVAEWATSHRIFVPFLWRYTDSLLSGL